MPVFSDLAQRGHEQVVFFNYPEDGLKAIVAVHNTTLGPALGGCRMRVYQDEAQALEDVLRLSEGMTYKSSLAGMDLGGGKACLILDPDQHQHIDRQRLFKRFGQCLNAMAGRYYTAEDMGTSPADMQEVRSQTNFVVGFPQEQGGSGDPSPWTALGVFNSIRAVCDRLYGTADLSQRSIAIEGVGHVGMPLVQHLRAAGARVMVSDINSANLETAKNKYGAEVVASEKLYAADCDIFAPCAIGQTVNAQTLPSFKFKAICGAANNQLQDATLYDVLKTKGILYCPDFVVNAGGVISVGAELRADGWQESWVQAKVAAIATTVQSVLSLSEQSGKFTEEVALDLARERIKQKQQSC